MKTDIMKTVTGDTAKQRNIFAATIIAGLLFGFVAGRIWSERSSVKNVIAETKTATTTLLSKALTAGTGAVAIIKKETPKTPEKSEVKPIAAAKKADKPAIIPKAKSSNTVVLSSVAAGDSVSVSVASLAQDSWIAIREDMNGEFGKALGAGWFPKGAHQNIVIELLRNTEAGKKYYAVLYADAGDHQFSSKTNKLITENGEAVSQVFIAK